MIKNTNDGKGVWYVCPECNRVLGINDKCPQCNKLGVWT